jgi:hypothetical protein
MEQLKQRVESLQAMGLNEVTLKTLLDWIEEFQEAEPTIETK